jgi:hypothetical protein
MATERTDRLNEIYSNIMREIGLAKTDEIRPSFVIPREIRAARQGLTDEEIPKSEKLQELVAELRLSHLFIAIEQANRNNDLAAACAVRTDHIDA